VPGEDLKGHDPFQMLAAGVPGAAEDMGDRTLVVVGAKQANGMPGFIVLEDQVNRLRGDMASGEELQDHSCKVATEADAAN
jgi:CDP-diacylglycerol pyrophosphatase